MDKDHSVTCALCGDLADERRTINLDPEAQYEASPTDFALTGRVFVARHLFGNGEAHRDCLNSKLLHHIREQAPQTWVRVNRDGVDVHVLSFNTDDPDEAEELAREQIRSIHGDGVDIESVEALTEKPPDER